MDFSWLLEYAGGLHAGGLWSQSQKEVLQRFEKTRAGSFENVATMWGHHLGRKKNKKGREGGQGETHHYQCV
jgi:hypothetical protein